jgi:hypothetical protein
MPATECYGGDEEARDGEEDLYAALTVPKEEVELGREVCGVGNVGEKQAHVDVIHENKKDREAAQEVDAVESF